MTLYKMPTKKAVLKALAPVARYFGEGMKPFFKSQKFLRKSDDGSVEFDVAYTQALEILPFVKKWLSNLVVVSLSDLKDALYRELEISMARLRP